MNSEETRLRSFSVWPINAPVCSRTLAANGFFATGNLLEVACNWCHCHISDWEFNDNVEERHTRLSPQCEFIINRHQCGNIPFSMTENDLLRVNQDRNTVVNEGPSSTAKEHRELDLLIEKDRLATFVNWPNPHITPQSLAKAGFFYRNRSDEVECAWCKGVIAQWEKQDNAFEEHRRFFPECPRVLLGPLIEIANDGIRDLGIQQISPPKNPKYTSLHSRLRTYSNWPIPEIQKPEDLAQAGLYYQKIDDQVRCFHCNMGLRSWEKEDDPWFEHAKWYPMCEFVRLVKGVNYIEEVQEKTRTLQSSDNPIVPMTIEEAMLTEPVKLALEMGIDADDLRNKTQQKILNSGRPFETIEDLLKAIFDEQQHVDSNTENSLPTCSSNNCRSPNRISQNRSLNTSSAINNHINIGNIPNNDMNLENVSDITSTPTETSSCIQISNDEISTKNHNTNDKIKRGQIDNDSQLPKTFAGENLAPDRKLLEEENRKLKDARLCKVCLDEEVGVVYLPCGHLVTCVQCAPGVNQCPMCRTTIKGFVRTYLS
ncbi:death-associated inhibitor of apoptosis 2 [Lucilia sericata]|uniref:death-associated inhibitor of apoptosis 2 n=1 Tax=Lucilia sericata TaxID=13632 RepID=UPI0018A877E1|nr:death-associated inhibitor of apoptosis 2 [Lucilia sericata]